MSDDFLSRWSQRKDEARREAAKIAPDPAPQPAGEPEKPAAEPVLAPEEIAALPRIEELTGDTDITGFLRPGVPPALRKAALRKSWLLDPAIRDFVGHARDYAYDWNAPGGAPGHGALLPGDDVSTMVQRILGAPDANPSGHAPGEKATDSASPAPPADGSPADPAHQETAADENERGPAPRE